MSRAALIQAIAVIVQTHHVDDKLKDAVEAMDIIDKSSKLTEIWKDKLILTLIRVIAERILLESAKLGFVTIHPNMCGMDIVHAFFNASKNKPANPPNNIPRNNQAYWEVVRTTFTKDFKDNLDILFKLANLGPHANQGTQNQSLQQDCNSALARLKILTEWYLLTVLEAPAKYVKPLSRRPSRRAMVMLAAGATLLMAAGAFAAYWILKPAWPGLLGLKPEHIVEIKPFDYPADDQKLLRGSIEYLLYRKLLANAKDKDKIRYHVRWNESSAKDEIDSQPESCENLGKLLQEEEKRSEIVATLSGKLKKEGEQNCLEITVNWWPLKGIETHAGPFIACSNSWMKALDSDVIESELFRPNNAGISSEEIIDASSVTFGKWEDFHKYFEYYKAWQNVDEPSNSNWANDLPPAPLSRILKAQFIRFWSKLKVKDDEHVLAMNPYDSPEDFIQSNACTRNEQAGQKETVCSSKKLVQLDAAVCCALWFGGQGHNNTAHNHLTTIEAEGAMESDAYLRYSKVETLFRLLDIKRCKDESLELARSQLRQGPWFALALNRYSQVAAYMGEFSQAVQAAECYRDISTRPNANDTLANVYLSKGESTRLKAAQHGYVLQAEVLSEGDQAKVKIAEDRYRLKVARARLITGARSDLIEDIEGRPDDSGDRTELMALRAYNYLQAGKLEAAQKVLDDSFLPAEEIRQRMMWSMASCLTEMQGNENDLWTWEVRVESLRSCVSRIMLTQPKSMQIVKKIADSYKSGTIDINIDSSNVHVWKYFMLAEIETARVVLMHNFDEAALNRLGAYKTIFFDTERKARLPKLDYWGDPINASFLALRLASAYQTAAVRFPEQRTDLNSMAGEYARLAAERSPSNPRAQLWRAWTSLHLALDGNEVDKSSVLQDLAGLHSALDSITSESPFCADFRTIREVTPRPQPGHQRPYKDKLQRALGFWSDGGDELDSKCGVPAPSASTQVGP